MSSLTASPPSSSILNIWRSVGHPQTANHAKFRRDPLCRSSLHQLHGRPQRGPFPCAKYVLSLPYSLLTPSPYLTSIPSTHLLSFLSPSFLLHTKVGWSTVPTPNNPTVGFQQPYDQYGGGAGGVQDIGVKGRLINLIGAVRTLMRSMYNSYRILFVHKKKGLTER